MYVNVLKDRFSSKLYVECNKQKNFWTIMGFKTPTWSASPTLSLTELLISPDTCSVLYDYNRAEREKYYKHGFKAKNKPDKYLSNIMDGMDQSKHNLDKKIRYFSSCCYGISCALFYI